MSDRVLVVVDTPSEQIQMVDTLLADHLALSQNVLCNIGHLIIVKVFAWHRTYLWYV